jgi:hypothetical protein
VYVSGQLPVDPETGELLQGSIAEQTVRSLRNIEAILAQAGCTMDHVVKTTVLLRDILFAPPLPYYAIHLACLTLSVAMLLMLTYFYARKDWKTYSKGNLWMICIIDIIIAVLYNIDIILEPADATSTYMMVEIWIRPTITYGLVACFIKGKEE